MHYSDHSDLFKHASSQKLVPKNTQQNTYTIFLSPSAGRYEGIQNTIWNTSAEPEYAILYIYFSACVDLFKLASSQKLVPPNLP